MNLTMEARPRASRTRVRMLCEGALLVAAAQILSYVKFLELPNGGSLTPAMFPVLLFAVRWGWKDGLLGGLVVGATIWAEYMPEEFLSMTMTSPWLYSLLYNGVYMLPNMVLALVIGALLYRPMGRYLTGADIE